jgi:soluble lytic murein transglycosylase
MLLSAVAVAGAVVLVVAGGGWGLFQKAISELTLPLEYSGIIRTEAAANHLPPELVAAVIYAETRYDPRTSPTGAEGLMQIEPQTAEFLAKRSGGYAFRVSDLGEPQVNIAYGSYYLRYLLNEYDNSPVAALAAYNGGETNVDHWLSDAGVSAQGFTAAEIPFPETRAYVDKVLSAEKDYRTTYARQLGYD